jgi:Putative zinc-finger
MNDCIDAEVRDALPDLIHGRLSDLDKATLTAHVEGCADCRAELGLLRQLRAAAPLAPRIDVGRIVSALPVPMPSAADIVASAPSRAVSSPRRSFVWKTAAAAALLVVGSLTFANVRHQSLSVSTGKPAASAVAVAATTAPVPQTVASLPSQEVATPRVAVAEPPKVVGTASRTGLSLTGGVQDLTDDQLQALVNDLDKVQGLPSAEPEVITIGVDDNEGLQ